MGVKGVVFDLDGTLIRSSVDFKAMKRRMIEILARYGVPRELLSTDKTTVENLRRAERIWDEMGVDQEVRSKALREVEEVMNEAELEALPTVEAIEGVREALEKLRGKGLKLAVLTRGHQTYAVEALRRTGLLELIDVILTRDTVRKPKPNPEALLEAAERLGLRVDEIIFVGDHPIDSACAEGASVRFIAVLTGWMREDEWRAEGVSEVVESVSTLPEYLDP
ncbi:MAG TPA: HAD family hydrolase [Candidatus Bathyarchaeota archaeon]|nr:HAD family hydrolase [Candidatus Bathyarchaeota archaeon]